ncbi:response regulator [Sedimenticola thiotaurini]|uniref:response regulator n=1 Tax=Sedimenticola thiotaurini TaxID=1543721 RepID=UPI0006995DF9|nr:response regulator [Sedimenticola thiotaurini]
MPEQQQKEQELKAAFIQHLPERIHSVDSDWIELSQDTWDPVQLKKLHQKVQSLTGTSGRFGLARLSENSYSLEVTLGGFMAADSVPTPKQKQAVSALITAIKHESELVRNNSGMQKPASRLIYLLLSSDKLAPGLVGMLEEQGCTVLSFLQPDDVEGEIQRRLPDVLIIDDSFLVRISMLNRELAIQQEYHKKQVGIICISQTRDLEQRLLALRSGVDGYYVTPVNTQDLAARIMEMASPKDDRYRILVVEDDQSQADFAASILRKSGMKTAVITESMKVIEALDEFRPDLILMDLYMPDANGIELTTIIREHPDFVTTPIVFLSGEQDTDKQLQALSVGGDDFLSKPIRPRHLINTITNRVQRARMLEKRQPHPNSRDRLTGLYHRRHFYEELDRMTTLIEERAATGGVLYISLEQTEGDGTEQKDNGYLANLGNLISGLLEEQDIASRIDDDSFAILILRPHQKNIVSLAENLARKLLALKTEAKLTPHIGIAIFGREQTSASDLIANASAASQAILGSDQYVKLYDEPDNHPGHEPATIQLPQLFRQALEKGSFQLLFRTLKHNQQPGTNAYMLKPRLPLSDGKYLGSAEIMSLGDQEQLGYRLSQWLIERALATLEEKRSEGRNNLLIVEQSAESIFQGAIAGWIRDQLRARQMVGVGLVLEYRIADLSVDLKTAKEHFTQLHEMGIKVSLSRFGANSTALKVLHYLGADLVQLAGPILKTDKIDDIISQIRACNGEIMLPTGADPGSISPAWLDSADWVPIVSAAPL